jgi:hypothetical protein
VSLVAKAKIVLAVTSVALLAGYVAAQSMGPATPVPTAAGAEAQAGGGALVIVSGGGGGGGGGSSGTSVTIQGAGNVGGTGGATFGGGGFQSTGGGGGGRSMSFTTNGTTSTIHSRDGSHDATMSTTNGTSTLTVKDAAGNVLFDGPYTSDADKAKLPPELSTLVNSMSNANINPATGVFGRGPGGTVFLGPAGASGAAGTSLESTLSSVKATLSPTDDQWTALQDPIRKVLKLKNLLAINGSFTLPMAAGDTNPLAAPAEALRSTTSDKSATDADVAVRVDAMQEARKKVTDDLAAAQKALEGLVTLRQRAVLIQMGVLE